MAKLLTAAALLATGAAIGAVIASNASNFWPVTDVVGATARAAVAEVGADWAATAPGRVEAASGEIRLAALAAGRITHIYVQENDIVEAGALLAELENSEQSARVQSAEADVAFRQAERDRDVANDTAKERLAAEDAVLTSEAEVLSVTTGIENLSTGPHSEKSKADANKAKAVLEAAKQRLDGARKAVQMMSAMAGSVPPSRTQSALSVARADLAVAVASLDKSKLRAPISGTILQITKRTGESIAPTADEPLFILADTAKLRVRAELNERDVGAVKLSQQVVVKAVAFPGERFNGRVIGIAPATRPKKLGESLNETPSGERILEVLVGLDQAKPLIPGLRVDTYFGQPQNKAIGDTGHENP